MAREVLEHIIKAQSGDKESMLILIEKFEPALKGYASAMRYEDAYNDLVVVFINTIQNLNLDYIRCKDDPGLIMYLRAAICHEHIEASKKQRSYECKTLLVDDFYDSADSWADMPISNPLRNSIFAYDLSRILTVVEAKIIHLHYFVGHSVQEIASMRKTSRQAVNKIKMRALKKIERNYFGQ